ncbi:YlqD family protein [Bacillus sp. FJAT-49732]|uniref:YlqD family protein n=1 Tax=Lederbergia citrisecunda TaxID=2833583 RepID=A0A942YJT2_9BACI|nr:YlqD family protein [Lederbergia citrisecunda]MBS4198932.1 YlqD family protein [Lederbergia citrisecunda]
MRILQTVSVKQVLTEMSKYKLLKKYKNNKQQLKKECDQLLFEMKKLERTRKFTQTGLKTQFDKEIAMRKEKVKLIDFQIEQLDLLPIGSELHDQDIQAIIDIKVGDNWEEITKGKTIVITDGIITEIRER